MQGSDDGNPAIVIVTHNSRRDLERFLADQIAASGRLATDLVVVDNNSSDGTVELLESVADHPRVSVLRMGRNAGYAAAVNAAFATLPGRDVLLINPDVELADTGPVRAMTHVLEREPRVAVVAPRLVDAQGEPQASARRFPSLLALMGSFPSGRRLGPARRAYERYIEPSRATEPRTVDWVLGAAMLIRRGAYDEIGGWDERFFLYVEDVDFCRRCARAGWEIAYLTNIEIHHGYAKASDAAVASALFSSGRRHHYRSHVRLFLREPRLLFGLGRSSMRRLSEPVSR